MIESKKIETLEEYLKRKPITGNLLHGLFIQKEINFLKEKTGIIYRIYNKLNGKMYIGSSYKSFNERYPGGNWDKHTHNRFLKEDVDKFGKENFEVEIYEHGYYGKDLKELEELLITSCRTLYPLGYNLRDDVSGFSDLTKEKMSISAKERVKRLGVPFKGMKHSAESRKLMSSKQRGRVLTEEHKAKIRASAPRGKNHALFGKKLSPEQLERLRNAPRAYVPVIQMDTNGNIIAEFASVKSASLQTGISSTSISRSCNSHLKAAGFKWRHKFSKI